MQIVSLWPVWPGQNQFINTKFTRLITKISKPIDGGGENPSGAKIGGKMFVKLPYKPSPDLVL